MCVLEGTYVWCVILIPLIVRDGEYGDSVGVIFAASLAQCMAVSASFSLWGWVYPTPFHL